MRHHETIDVPATPPFRAFALLGAWIFITSSAPSALHDCLISADAESLDAGTTKKRPTSQPEQAHPH
jgi:hypothetical protein